ncbi:hypothetical protein FJY94_04550 [Candidatus Kaiserbacteria bacterium]|nr:hypothetical protein [Candidatus Kaiserbacteria bacterium]
MGNKFIVVTNCTAKKKAGIPLVLFAPNGNCLRQVAEDWRISLAAQSSRLQAGRLYVGRSIHEARNVSQDISAPLFIVSAGIGLVGSDEQIPGYDMSASGKETALAVMLARIGASKSDWWRQLGSGKGFGWLLRENPEATVLISLPSEYLGMVLGDLEALPSGDLSRIRVFTSPAGQKKIGKATGVPSLPYDERLESIIGYAGTRSDFPQRALKHFVAELSGHLLPIDEASRAVATSLGGFERKSLPQRKRLDDGKIRGLIRQAWESVGGNSAKLLRHLRDTELVSCEQGRFSMLRRQVEAEIRGTGIYTGSTS